MELEIIGFILIGILGGLFQISFYSGKDYAKDFLLGYCTSILISLILLICLI